MASIHIAQSRLDGIKSIMGNYERQGKTHTDQYIYWEKQAQHIENVVNEFNRQVQSADFAFSNGMAGAKRSKGGKYATDVTYIYRGSVDKKGNFVGANRIKSAIPGEYIFWEKGDVVVENPKRIEAGNGHVSKVRRAHADAFGRVLFGMEGSMLSLEAVVTEFNKNVRNIGNDFMDVNSPMVSDRFNFIGEFELRYLADAIDQVQGWGPQMTGGKLMAQKQFIMMLMTPRLKGNVFSVTGYNIKEKSAQLSPSYESNARNERIVLKFLERAMAGKTSTSMSAENAKEIYEYINLEFKKAFVRQWDKTLQGDIFRFEQSSRKVDDFSLLNPIDGIPKMLTKKNILQSQREVMQAYLTGSYFMDPAALYRFTLGMTGAVYKNGKWTIPGGDRISKTIESLWEGTDGRHISGDQGIFIPNHIFRKSNAGFVRRNNKDLSKIGEGIEEIDNTCFGN